MPLPFGDDHLICRSQSWIHELNRCRKRNRNGNSDPNRPPPWNRKAMIMILKEIKNGRPGKLPQDHEYDDDDDYHVEPTRKNDGFVSIEEVLKGQNMDPTWKRKIFSQHPEDDDQELRKQLDNVMKYYTPYLAPYCWDKERYCILERREYDKDVNTTEGFEVGYYPYMMMKALSGMIVRYYCPPDADLPDHSIARLFFCLAVHAIQFYNSTEQTNYSVVKVIKTMTSAAAGTWFYMTFQATTPYYGDQPWTFEAKLFESIPYPQPYVEVQFVRLKMGAGHSSLIHELYAANLIQEPQACSNSLFNPFAG